MGSCNFRTILICEKEFNKAINKIKIFNFYIDYIPAQILPDKKSTCQCSLSKNIDLVIFLLFNQNEGRKLVDQKSCPPNRHATKCSIAGDQMLIDQRWSRLSFYILK